MMKGFPAISAYLDELNVTPTREPFTVYHGIDWKKLHNQSGFRMFLEMFTRKWDIEFGFPVPEELPGRDAIKPSSIASFQGIVGTHRGAYQKVGKTYNAMLNWAVENDIPLENLADWSVEFYLNDPCEVATSELETEVWIPMKA